MAQHALHCTQCLGTNVVLDPLAVHGRGITTDSQFLQKLQHDFMAFMSHFGHAFSGCSQANWLVGSRLHQPMPLQSGDRVVDRCVRNREVVDQIDRPANTMLCLEGGDGFHVVFSNFGGVRFARLIVNLFGQRAS